ncbi:MAG: arsenic resistance N-acetyltransferase ArsN2 [Vicinamibacterales bacterium]
MATTDNAPAVQVRIERATDADAPSIIALLSASGLPIDGLVDHLDTAIVARRGQEVVGCAALEVYSDGALLRSVAVSPGARGTGLGQALTGAALRLAEELGVPAVYLLTTTAERFFPRFGFSVVHRSDVPAGVQQSVEFRTACCASAIVMRKALQR